MLQRLCTDAPSGEELDKAEASPIARISIDFATTPTRCASQFVETT